MKKILSFLLICMLTAQPVWAADTTVVIGDSEVPFKGLERLKADRIEDGAHSKFDNVYLTREGNIRSIKGRDKLNAAAPADTTINMLCYYENAAGTTKKLVVKESDDLVTYAVDGTSRTVISASANSLTDEPADCVQVGDTMYITSATDGVRKWTGSGNEAAVGSVSAPSSVDFTVDTSATGGMTSGTDIIISADLDVDGQCNTLCDGATAVDSACVYINSEDMEGSGVTSDTGTLETAGVDAVYLYKVTKSNSKWGFESEASTSDTVSLGGDDTFTWSATNCSPCDFDHTDATCDNQCCTGITASTTGRDTATNGTSAASPGDPWDQYCYYRTPANGEDYFLAFCSKTFSGTVNDGKPDVSLDRPLDTTIDTIAPPSLRYIEAYKGVLFVAEGDEVRFSHLPVQSVTDMDKYWLETDMIKTAKKYSVTGLTATNNSLLIFTPTSVQEITGFGVGSFRVTDVVNGVGSVSDEAVEVDNNGDVIFFAGVQGVYKLRTLDQLTDDLTGAVVDQPRTKLVRITAPWLDKVFNGTDDQISLTLSDYTSSHAYFDQQEDLYHLFIGQDEFIFNNQNGSWSHVPASKMSHSVYRKSPAATGVGVLADDLGYFYDNWTGNEMAAPSGDVTGNPTSSTSTTLVDTGATFYTTSDGLAGTWVFLDNENGEWRRISSNTSTALTVDTAWTTNPVTTDTYYIGYIIPEVQTKQYKFAPLPEHAKVNNFFLAYNVADSTQSLDIYGFANKETFAVNANNSDVNKSASLDSKGIAKLNFPMGRREDWFHISMKTYIYNTSDSVSPPLDIISYGIQVEDQGEIK